jgi:integrase
MDTRNPTRRGSTAGSRTPRRVFLAKQRCRNAVGLIGGRCPSEDGLTRAIVELGKAQKDLDAELTAMKVRRLRDAKSAARVARNLKDARGRRRGYATLPGYHTGRAPANKGVRYGKTPPSTHEVMRMLEHAPSLRLAHEAHCPSCGAEWRTPHKPTCINPYAERWRALMYVLWRGGLRITCEALRLVEGDLFPAEGYLHVANGKGGKPRDVAIDDWVWPRLEPWLRFRQTLPDGPLFCVLEGPTAGVRPWSAPAVRHGMHELAALAKVRRRCAPHQLRHAMVVDQLDDGVNLLYISRQLGHANLAITTTYLEGLPQSRVINELRGRPVPKVSVLEMLTAPPIAMAA